ncbi:hypothetical protein OH779_12730 [Actinacidiphila glaucinigra]
MFGRVGAPELLLILVVPAVVIGIVIAVVRRRQPRPDAAAWQERQH